MDHASAARISVTPTIARQTPKNEFGQVLSNTVNGAIKAGGAIVGSLSGMPIVSSAVSAVTSLTGSGGTARSVSSAATGVVSIGGGSPPPTSLGGANTAADPSDMNGMISAMRTESDRSMLLQMNMQTESREYNTLTNILKLRHDSAKAAINNIR